MDEFTLGDLVIMEVALCQFMNGIDINMFAGQQVQQSVAKIETKINKLSAAAKDQDSDALRPPTDLQPKTS